MKNKVKRELDGVTRASVMREMAKPRIAKSAREAEVNLVVARVAQGKLLKTQLSLLLPVRQRACK